MDNALMIGLSRQVTLRRAMEASANNLANMNTVGFKLESPVYAEAPERPASHEDGPRDIAFVEHWAMARDFSEGALQPTGRPLDLAIRGEGFFAVEADGATRYTRDGRFAVGPEGLLTTMSGAPVLDEAGGEIQMPDGGGRPQITSDGAILVDGAEIARIQVVEFPDRAALVKEGEGLFNADGAAPPAPVEVPDVRQGFVEASNVNAILEMTRMIEIQRAYQSVTRMLNDQHELKRDAVDKMARV